MSRIAEIHLGDGKHSAGSRCVSNSAATLTAPVAKHSAQHSDFGVGMKIFRADSSSVVLQRFLMTLAPNYSTACRYG